MATKQVEAISAAQEVADLAGRFIELLDMARDLSNKITVNGYLTVLGALPTAPWNSDGTIGTTDTTPVATNPITSGTLYIPSNDITAGVYLLNDFINFMTNTDTASRPTAKDRTADVAKIVR